MSINLKKIRGCWWARSIVFLLLSNFIPSLSHYLTLWSRVCGCVRESLSESHSKIKIIFIWLKMHCKIKEISGLQGSGRWRVTGLYQGVKIIKLHTVTIPHCHASSGHSMLCPPVHIIFIDTQINKGEKNLECKCLFILSNKKIKKYIALF